MVIACVIRIAVTITSISGQGQNINWGYYQGSLLLTAFLPILFLVELRFKTVGTSKVIGLSLLAIAFWGTGLFVNEFNNVLAWWIIFAYVVFINGAVLAYYSVRKEIGQPWA
jgi:hypothetical protein